MLPSPQFRCTVVGVDPIHSAHPILPVVSPISTLNRDSSKHHAAFCSNHKSHNQQPSRQSRVNLVGPGLHPDDKFPPLFPPQRPLTELHFHQDSAQKYPGNYRTVRALLTLSGIARQAEELLLYSYTHSGPPCSGSTRPQFPLRSPLRLDLYLEPHLTLLFAIRTLETTERA